MIISNYSPLAPDLFKPVAIRTAEEGWQLRKKEIDDLLGRYMRQRRNAYIATGTLTIERENLLKKARIDLANAKPYMCGEYAKRIRNIVNNMYALLPATEPTLSTWLFRLTAISHWCNKFN